MPQRLDPLIAVATLNPAAQQQVYRAIRVKGLNALETEQFVQDTRTQSIRVDRRGAQRAERIRFKTTNALVLLQFRRGKVTTADILTALDEARTQAKNNTGGMKS